jgi:hypothetical protein
MIKQIERQAKDSLKELGETQKERNLLRFQPCKGDAELRRKDRALEELDRRIEALNEKIRELEKKRRDLMSEVHKKADYESPFS